MPALERMPSSERPRLYHKTAYGFTYVPGAVSGYTFEEVKTMINSGDITKEFTDPIDNFLDNVQAEIEQAQKKFPCTDNMMTALTEEVGEVAKALLDEPWENVYKEAVQVAAMACRLAIEGDPTHIEYRARNKKGALHDGPMVQG